MARELLNMMLEEDFKDFANVESVSDSIEESNKKGDIVFHLDINEEKLKKITENISSDFDVFKFENLKHQSEYFDDYSDTVKIIRKATMKKALPFLFKILNEEDKNFGGMLFINSETGFMLNPLHPLIFAKILRGEIETPKEFDIFIYEFENENNYNYMKNWQDNGDWSSNFDYYDIEKYRQENENKIIIEALKMHSIMFEIYSEYNNPNIKNKIKIVGSQKNFDTVYDLYNIDSEITVEKESEIQTIMIPLQIITKGEILPYIGYTAVNKNIRTVALPGNATGNLNHAAHGGEKQVCTGDKPNNIIEGWYTLSKINANSVWYKTYINVYHKEITKAAFIFDQELLKKFIAEQAAK